MLSVEEALAQLVDGLGQTEPEDVALTESVGRVPVQRMLTAAFDVPPFANSAMDGFAVIAADGAVPRPVIGESRAGGPPPPRVEAGTAVRIMTGAPVPDGADAVVPIEEASEQGPTLHVQVAPRAGAHVRPAGHDVAAGTEVSLPDAPLSAATVGLLAAMGHASVSAHRPPRVAILSTGDELAAAGARLGPGQIHDANGPALAAAVVEAGGEPMLLPRAGDDASAIEERLLEGARTADLVLVSGGVSVGQHDHVRSVIENLGSLAFWRIAVQPGKPLAFGTIGERRVVGLPGNPVSALVTFELFVRPMIRRMLSLSGDGRLRIRARVDETLGKDMARRAFLRVRIKAEGDGYRAVSAGGQASSQLLPLAWANALLIVPEGVHGTVPGESYAAILTGPVA